ncbi:hypothetical protein [Streptomyces sp. NPDC101115]|uniref:hypothetical protein n=1 Tax=Streptomyces sp. NPDC101115 TaxID=3366106 RepID=UPI00381E60F2
MTIDTTVALPAGRLTPRAARRLAAVERVLYGAGGVFTAWAPHADLWQLDTAAIGAGVGTLAWLWRRSRIGGLGLLSACYRALPLLGLSGAYTAALAVPGSAWWEIATPVAVAAAAGIASPLTRSAGIAFAVAELPAADADDVDGVEVIDDAEVVDLDDYLSILRHLWAVSPVTAGTELVDIRHPDPTRPDFTALILAEPGRAIPSALNDNAVAAVFDVPTEAVTLTPVKGYGPGRLALTVAPAAAEETAAETAEADEVRTLWAERVSGPNGAAPGMRLVDYRLADDRLVVLVEAADDRMIALPRKRLARALRVEDPDLVMVETDGLGTGVVTIYKQHPLIHIREATRADLTMAADGTVAIGLRHDGRLARMPLYDPELGALTDLLVGAPGSGKSVTLLTLLAAERLSGVVSVVADAQDGMSLPEADGRVFHFGAGRAAFAATLAAVCAVADFRERISAANGWGSFTLGDPWRLLITTLDEINRVLAADADVHKDFRRWVTGMIARIQLTGRKLGLGIRFAGQSIHLEDLGDSDKIRSGAKQGTVWLGRVNGTMTKRMAVDMTSGTVEVTPIPRYFGAGGAGDVAAAWAGEETASGPVTAGCAWMIQAGIPCMTRVFRAVKTNRTYPGLIALLEAAPLPGLTPEETAVFREAYAEALPYAEWLMVRGLKGFDDEGEGGTTAPAPVTVSAPTAATTAGPSLRDLVLGALAAGPCATSAIRKAVGVGDDDGPTAGAVGNLLTRLREEGLITPAGHGKWQLAPTGD